MKICDFTELRSVGNEVPMRARIKIAHIALNDKVCLNQLQSLLYGHLKAGKDNLQAITIYLPMAENTRAVRCYLAT